MKVERGIETSRTIRQWKKDVRDKYMPWVNEMSKLSDCMAKRQADIVTEEDKSDENQDVLRKNITGKLSDKKGGKFSKKNCKLNIESQSKKLQDQLTLNFLS